MSLKALMIVSGVFGMNGDYTTKMPSMEECMAQKQVVEAQASEMTVTCVPRMDEKIDSDRFFAMMELFMSFVTRMREEHRDYCFDNPFSVDCEPRESSSDVESIR